MHSNVPKFGPKFEVCLVLGTFVKNPSFRPSQTKPRGGVVNRAIPGTSAILSRFAARDTLVIGPAARPFQGFFIVFFACPLRRQFVHVLHYARRVDLDQLSR